MLCDQTSIPFATEDQYVEKNISETPVDGIPEGFAISFDVLF